MSAVAARADGGEGDTAVDAAAAAGADSLSAFASLPNLLPATLGRFLSDADVAACLCACRALRSSLALHDAFWRYICHRTYRPPAYRPPKLAGLERFASWRAYWLDRPRVRTTGFYAVKISYIPSTRILPPGQVEVGSNAPARRVGEFPLVTYYRYFWFQPDGQLRHLCSPSTPSQVKAAPGGLYPPSTTRECLGRNVTRGRYYVRKSDTVHIVVPNISTDTNIVATARIQDVRDNAEGVRYGAPPLRPRPARGAFNTLIPVMFALESPAFNGDTFRQQMPIPFGEKFHFHACTVTAAAEKRAEGVTSAARFSSSRFAAVGIAGVGHGGDATRGMSKHEDGALGAVQLTAEEERKAAEEASL